MKQSQAVHCTADHHNTQFEALIRTHNISKATGAVITRSLHPRSPNAALNKLLRCSLSGRAA